MHRVELDGGTYERLRVCQRSGERLEETIARVASENSALVRACADLRAVTPPRGGEVPTSLPSLPRLEATGSE
jgi:hypothetical protein